MVDFYREERRQETEVGSRAATADAVCPVCFQALAKPTIIGQWEEQGLRMRKYLGFCQACNLGCETIQFFLAGRWRVHKYQTYSYMTKDYASPPISLGEWVTLNEMPKAGKAGGEIGEMTEQLLRSLDMSLEGVCQTIKCILNALDARGKQ